MTDEKPIRLRVVSVMTDPDGGRHESKTVHRGTLRAGEDGLEIAYEQVDEGVRACICLTWTADGVRMRRTGEMTGALHFQPGRKTAGLYGTAYGDIPVAVYTPMFAMARIAGWCAHRLEELISAKRIIRPAYKTLAEEASYIPLSERG